jgi:DNA helicase-2/ATP-dependent DNA helicase PcrA
MNLKFDLNKQQRKAVTTTEGPVIVLAGAGSGKTRTLTYRISYLIHKGVNPNNILTLTFTNKAAEDMQRKVEELLEDKTITNQLWMGTFHSVCVRILSRHLEKVGYEENFVIYDQDESKTIVNKIIADLGLSKDDYETDIVYSLINKYKMDLKTPNEVEEQNVGEFYENIATIYNRYEKQLRLDNAFDFNDLIKKTIELFQQNPRLLRHYQNKFKYVMIDEYQDTNHSQYKLATMLSKPQENIFVVGDDYQCQPPETNVLTCNGYKKIKDLNPKQDKIVSYDRKSNYVTGLTERYGYNFEKASRHYNDLMFEIKTTDDKVSKATYNHKWITKWSDKSTDYNVVYLMKKDDKFRIGWCQLFNSQGAFHLGTRARIENADSVWILKLCDNKQKASKWESIIATRYGIPTVTFKGTDNENSYLTNEVIKGIYNELSNSLQFDRAINCLNDYDKYLEYPIWNIEDTHKKQGGKTIQKIQSCNLIPDLMKIPIHKSGKEVEWKNIEEINKNHYEGKIYSLNVEKHHKYISNEMVTCNSIYAFRGANMENILRFHTKDYPDATVVKLERNYRCANNIIEASNAVIKNNKKQAEKRVWTDKTSKKPVVVCESKDEIAEADFVTRTIDGLVNGSHYMYKDIAILYRCNYQSREFERLFIKNKIPHTIVGNVGFFDRKEIKDVMAIINLMLNPNNVMHISRLVNLESNGIGTGTIGRISDYAIEEGVKFMDIINNDVTKVRGIGKVKGKRIGKFVDRLLNPIIEVGESDLSLPLKIKTALSRTNYKDILRNEDNFDNRKANVDELLNLAMNYYKKDEDRDLVDFVRDVKLMSDQDDLDEDDNAVKLMTAHASKGLEFPVVFLVGMEEDTFPFGLAIEESGEEGVEEERRLCYVGMTRAEERLFISHRKFVDTFQGRESKTKSRFLKEIPETVKRYTRNSSPLNDYRRGRKF